MATEPNDEHCDQPGKKGDEVAKQPGGRYAELAAFIGEEGLGAYFAAGGLATDPVLRTLYGLDE